MDPKIRDNLFFQHDKIFLVISLILASFFPNSPILIGVPGQSAGCNPYNIQ